MHDPIGVSRVLAGMGLAEGLHLQPAAKDGVIELHRLAGVVFEAQVRVQFGCHGVSFERAKLLAETGSGPHCSTSVRMLRQHGWPARAIASSKVVLGTFPKNSVSGLKRSFGPDTLFLAIYLCSRRKTRLP